MTTSLPAEVEAACGPGRGIVLFVDDEDLVRSMAKSTLNKYGYGVLLAENGQQAVDLFRDGQHIIDLVVMDLAMPVMGGQQAVAMLRAINSEIPIIVSSGYSQIDVVERFQGQRMAGFLQKPYTCAALVEAVEGAQKSCQLSAISQTRRIGR